jgi:Mce-associated membrane protein
MADDDVAAPDGEPIASAGEHTYAEDGFDDLDDADDDDEDTRSPLRLALTAGVVLVVALAALTGWLGYRAYEAHEADAQRALYLEVGRQAAQNLTTIDWQHADSDVQRVLDVATGTFYDDYQQRAQPFIEVVREAKSKSVGTLGESGVESVSDTEAKVLVAVNVTSQNVGAPEQTPRAWRMRLTVQRVGDEAKVSNVEFVQ